MESNGDGPVEALPSKPLVKAHALESTAPMGGDSAALTASPSAGGSGGAAVTVGGGGGAAGNGLPRPPGVGVGAAAAVASAGAAGGGGGGGGGGSAQSDDDDSSWGGPSDQENPSELRRSSSNSSISTLGSTSTASSSWPNEAGYVTPARTEIARGGGGGSRYGGRGKGHVVVGSGGVDLPVGFRTPASLAAANTPGRAVVPETPSPRSATGSGHGTPHVSCDMIVVCLV